MSLFDDDLATKSFLKVPSPEGTENNLNQLEKIQGRNFLSRSEDLALKKFYAKCFTGSGLFPYITTLLERKVQITISDKDKSFPAKRFSIDEAGRVNPYKLKREKRIVILGEYLYGACKDEIILYITNIRAAAKDFEGSCKEDDRDIDPYPKTVIRVNTRDLLLNVFAHELYHAFFHKQNPIPEEETLAEFGSLLYMNNYLAEDSLREKKITGLYRMIIQKKEWGLYNYSRGAELFLRTSDTFHTKEEIINLIEEYKNESNPVSSKFSAQIDKLIYSS